MKFNIFEIKFTLYAVEMLTDKLLRKNLNLDMETANNWINIVFPILVLDLTELDELD